MISMFRSSRSAADTQSRKYGAGTSIDKPVIPIRENGLWAYLAASRRARSDIALQRS